LQPRAVPAVHTAHRRIATPIPAPESIPILEQLRQFEPVSMSGQPLVLWDHAQGVHVSDRWGNQWLDWSSGVLVANAGHSHPRIVAAIRAQAEHGLLHNYCFPSELRARLVATCISPSHTTRASLRPRSSTCRATSASEKKRPMRECPRTARPRRTAMLIGDKSGPAIIATTYGDVRPDHLLVQAKRVRVRSAAAR
jgi:hypothetical protein